MASGFTIDRSEPLYFFFLASYIYSKRGRSEIGSIGRIIFHCFISVGRINSYGVDGLTWGATFFLVYLVGVHGRSWCRFTAGVLEHPPPLHGYCNQTIRDQSRLRRIPKDRQEGHIQHSHVECLDLSVYGSSLSSTLLCSRGQDGCLGHLLLILMRWSLGFEEEELNVLSYPGLAGTRGLAESPNDGLSTGVLREIGLGNQSSI